MKVTAKEAEGKRCQEAFPAANGLSHGGGIMHYTASGMPPMYAGSSHIQASGGAPMFCIAGECMAWRWTDKRTGDGDLLGYCGKARHRD